MKKKNQVFERIKICNEIIKLAENKSKESNQVASQILHHMVYLAKILKKELETFKPKEGHKFCSACGREYKDTLEFFAPTYQNIFAEDDDGYPYIAETKQKPGKYCHDCSKLYSRIERKQRKSTNLYSNGLYNYLLGNFRFVKDNKQSENKKAKAINSLLRSIEKAKEIAKEVEEINNKILERVYIEKQEREYYERSKIKTEDSYFLDEEDEYY